MVTTNIRHTHQQTTDTQNTALKITTAYTSDTNTQHIHNETLVLPLKIPSTTRITDNTKKTQQATPKLMKQTTFNYTTDINTNYNTINNTQMKTNLKHIHDTIVNIYSQTEITKITNTIPLSVYHTETTLPIATRHILAQLRTNQCPLLNSYLNKIDASIHLSSLCSLCKAQPRTTHLFNCTKSTHNSQICGDWMERATICQMSKLNGRGYHHPEGPETDVGSP